jgi:hypothetical protein
MVEVEHARQGHPIVDRQGDLTPEAKEALVFDELAHELPGSTARCG